MARADSERWDARYRGRPMAEPSRPVALTDELDAVVPTRGRALDVACGAGGQALWLAERGVSVVAIDASPEAVLLTVAAKTAAGLDQLIEVHVVDLDDGIPDHYDGFDVIVCQRYRQPDLYPSFVERLNVGGVAIVTVLSQSGATQAGPFHAEPGELARAFARPDCEVLHHTEGDGEESIVVRRIVG